MQIKDIFRLGRFTNLQSSSSRPRPLLIKLCTAWDRKLVLLRKSKLRDFHIKRLFIREDVDKDNLSHYLREIHSHLPLLLHPILLRVARLIMLLSGLSDSRQPQCLHSSRSASPETMSHFVSPSSTSSASSSTVVLGSGGNQNGSS